MTRSDGKPNKSCCDRRELAKTKDRRNFKEDNFATPFLGRDMKIRYCWLQQRNNVMTRE